MKRVLIVDDQPHVLDLVREILASFQHGHAVEPAEELGAAMS